MAHAVPSGNQIGLKQWDPSVSAEQIACMLHAYSSLSIQGQHGESRALLLLKSLSQASLASSVERHSSEESETIVCSLLASPEREEASSASPVKSASHSLAPLSQLHKERQGSPHCSVTLCWPPTGSCRCSACNAILQTSRHEDAL